MRGKVSKLSAVWEVAVENSKQLFLMGSTCGRWLAGNKVGFK